jgi:type III pantothenate kinase
LTATGDYLGGSISLGLKMRFKALQHFTAKLPLIEDVENQDFELIGTSTKTAMQSGVIYGLKSEIEGIIDLYHQKFGEVLTVICGGDADFLAKQIKLSIFVDSKLLMTGLNAILQYNIKAKQ